MDLLMANAAVNEFGHSSKVLHIYRNVVEAGQRRSTGSGANCDAVQGHVRVVERPFQDLVSQFRAATCAQNLWRFPGFRNRVHAPIVQALCQSPKTFEANS